MESMKGNRLIPKDYTVEEWDKFSYEERVKELRISSVDVSNNDCLSQNERQLHIDAIKDEIDYYRGVLKQIGGLCK